MSSALPPKSLAAASIELSSVRSSSKVFTPASLSLAMIWSVCVSGSESAITPVAQMNLLEAETYKYRRRCISKQETVLPADTLLPCLHLCPIRDEPMRPYRHLSIAHL